MMKFPNPKKIYLVIIPSWVEGNFEGPILISKILRIQFLQKMTN